MNKTYHGFNELAEAFGVKGQQQEREEILKCPNCGSPLRRVDDSNVYVCDFSLLDERFLKNGKSVLVFNKCNYSVIKD